MRRSDERRIAALCLGVALAACQQQMETMPPEPIPPPPFAAEGGAPATSGGIGTDEKLTIARACASDIERFCAGVPPRQGEIKACMKAHVTELSAGCFDTVMDAVAAAHSP